MNIVDLILSNPDQANSAVADSLQARVFDYLDNYQLAEESIDEGAMHPAGTALLKHINPKHHSVYKPFLTKKVFTGSYKDRSDVLNAAKTAGHLAEESLDEATNTVTKDKNGKITGWKHEGDWKKSKPTTDKQAMSKVKADTEGARKWSEQLTKEDLDAMDQEEFDALVENFEQLDELSKATLSSYMTKNTKESEKKNSKQSMSDKMKRIDGYWKASDKLSK